MSEAHTELDAAISEVEAARKRVRAKKTPQVKSGEEQDYLRSVAYSWLNSRRGTVLRRCPNADCSQIDKEFYAILEATHKSASRSTYDRAFKHIKSALVSLRSAVPIAGQPSAQATFDPPPDFSALASDQLMREILRRRWDECQRCILAEAHLAATVMMGGLLEALFVARANTLTDKSPLFRSKAAPVDPQTKKPRPLKEWMLGSYIDVGHELGWITKSAKDVATVLRESRNYVHPEKERRDNVVLKPADTSLYWSVTKQLAVQLLQVR